MKRRSSQRGFTLIELMISLVLFSFAIAGVLAVAVSMTQGFREQRAAVEAEGSVRVPIDFIGDALRQASPGAPTNNIQDAALCTTTGAISVTNNQTAIHDATITGWDQLDVIFASGAVVTSTRGVYAAGTTSMDVTDASQLAVGDSIVISDTNQGHLVKITGIGGNTLTLAPQCGGITLPPTGNYAMGSLVIRAQHATFTLDAVDGIPTLMMDPDAGGPAVAEPLAEGVEDMQIALGIDANGDGVIAEQGTGPGDDEWQGNFAGDPLIVGPLRAVRVTLISRTTSGLIGNLNSFSRPAAEDHAASGVLDTYRRRALRTLVEVRNMGGSP
jgi:prepilin-type N-terminal cleavage/methylation domain-containing protein